MSSLLICGGRLIAPEDRIDQVWDVLIEDGVVAAIEKPGILSHKDTGAELLDAKGCVVAPGLIDVHVHLREPGQTYKETIATGTRAAAAGGFTTVVAMPNTVPVNDSAEKMTWMLDEARQPAVRLYAMPAATEGSLGERLTDFAALRAAGALGFTDDGKPILEDVTMRAALVAAARLDVPISQHAEDPAMSHGAIMHAGPMAFRLGLRGYPAEAEAKIVRRDIALLREIERAEGLRPHLHVQHVSTELALLAIRAAKAEGFYVTCEAAPHHFALTDEAIGEFDTNCKMNPPLRSEGDRQAVIAGLLDGTVDCIATDHAPHARHEKEVEFERAANGITGLETALGLAIRILHGEHGMPLMQVIGLMSANPARIVGLEGAGALRRGKWGDAVVFDAAEEWDFRVAETRSKSRNTPFDRARMMGRVKATVVAGKIVYGG